MNNRFVDWLPTAVSFGFVLLLGFHLWISVSFKNALVRGTIGKIVIAPRDKSGPDLAKKRNKAKLETLAMGLAADVRSCEDSNRSWPN